MKKFLLFLLVSIILAAPLFYTYGRSIWVPVYYKIAGNRSVADVIQIYGKEASNRIKPYFDKAGVNYPPKEIVILAIKDKKQIELWASSDANTKFIRSIQ